MMMLLHNNQSHVIGKRNISNGKSSTVDNNRIRRRCNNNCCCNNTTNNNNPIPTEILESASTMMHRQQHCCTCTECDIVPPSQRRRRRRRLRQQLCKLLLFFDSSCSLYNSLFLRGRRRSRSIWETIFVVLLLLQEIITMRAAATSLLPTKNRLENATRTTILLNQQHANNNNKRIKYATNNNQRAFPLTLLHTINNSTTSQPRRRVLQDDDVQQQFNSNSNCMPELRNVNACVSDACALCMNTYETTFLTESSNSQRHFSCHQLGYEFCTALHVTPCADVCSSSSSSATTTTNQDCPLEEYYGCLLSLWSNGECSTSSDGNQGEGLQCTTILTGTVDPCLQQQTTLTSCLQQNSNNNCWDCVDTIYDSLFIDASTEEELLCTDFTTAICTAIYDTCDCTGCESEFEDLQFCATCPPSIPNEDDDADEYVFQCSTTDNDDVYTGEQQPRQQQIDDVDESSIPAVEVSPPVSSPVQIIIQSNDACTSERANAEECYAEYGIQRNDCDLCMAQVYSMSLIMSTTMSSSSLIATSDVSCIDFISFFCPSLAQPSSTSFINPTTGAPMSIISVGQSVCNCGGIEDDGFVTTDCAKAVEGLYECEVQQYTDGKCGIIDCSIPRSYESTTTTQLPPPIAPTTTRLPTTTPSSVAPVSVSPTPLPSTTEPTISPSTTTPTMTPSTIAPVIVPTTMIPSTTEPTISPSTSIPTITPTTTPTTAEPTSSSTTTAPAVDNVNIVTELSPMVVITTTAPTAIIGQTTIAPSGVSAIVVPTISGNNDCEVALTLANACTMVNHDDSTHQHDDDAELHGDGDDCGGCINDTYQALLSSSNTRISCQQLNDTMCPAIANDCGCGECRHLIQNYFNCDNPCPALNCLSTVTATTPSPMTTPTGSSDSGTASSISGSTSVIGGSCQTELKQVQSCVQENNKHPQCLDCIVDTYATMFSNTNTSTVSCDEFRLGICPAIILGIDSGVGCDCDGCRIFVQEYYNCVTFELGSCPSLDCIDESVGDDEREINNDDPSIDDESTPFSIAPTAASGVDSSSSSTSVPTIDRDMVDPPTISACNSLTTAAALLVANCVVVTVFVCYCI